MKITGYRLLRSYHNWGRPIGDVNGFIDSGITEVPIVIVETDEGISGVATGSHEGVDRVFPAIDGQDPRAVSTLYDRMLARVFKAGHAGSTFGGIGTLDSALWDLKAKIAGEPLWRLLGASDRFVAGYASGLDIALSDDELAGVLPHDGRARIQQRQAEGRPRCRAQTSAASASCRTRSRSTPPAPHSCSTRTNRGTSSRPFGTSR